MNETISKEQVGLARIYRPYATLQEIGNDFRVTRERIRQILASLHLPTRHIALRWQRMKPCLNCGELTLNKFCSHECLNAHYRTMVVCGVCGKEFPQRIKDRDYRKNHRGYQHTFCSNQCQGKWLGTNYGRGMQAK